MRPKNLRENGAPHPTFSWLSSNRSRRFTTTRRPHGIGSCSFHSDPNRRQKALPKLKMRHGRNMRMRPVVSSVAAQPWRTPWTSSAGTTTKAAESSAFPNGIPSASIWLTMKVAAAIGVGATRVNRRSCASRIVWIGKPSSTVRNCVNANIGSGVDTGINSGHSAADTPASDQGKVL